jgi:hypothetical protein
MQKYIDLKEFREIGYLHELNRQFLHPHGLAFEVTTDKETGAVTFSGIQDNREYLDGMAFKKLDIKKIGNINLLMRGRVGARTSAIGNWVQFQELV